MATETSTVKRRGAKRTVATFTTSERIPADATLQSDMLAASFARMLGERQQQEIEDLIAAVTERHEQQQQELREYLARADTAQAEALLRLAWEAMTQHTHGGMQHSVADKVAIAEGDLMHLPAEIQQLLDHAQEVARFGQLPMALIAVRGSAVGLDVRRKGSPVFDRLVFVIDASEFLPVPEPGDEIDQFVFVRRQGGDGYEVAGKRLSGYPSPVDFS